MRLRGVVALTAIVSMVFASTAIAATAPPMARTVSCISTGMNPRISATVPASLSAPRVFFRANGERTEYYVDMHRNSGQNEWFAILPSIEPSTRTITYRVAAVDDSKNWIVSAPVTVSAAKSCPSMLTAEEQSMASGIVLGLTSAGQSDVPPGFSCRGITNVIGVDCQMRPADGCRRLLASGLTGVAATGVAGAAAAAGAAGVAGAAAAGAAAGAAGIAGLSAAALAGLAAAGLAAGLAVYSATKNNNTSPSTP